MTPILQNLIPRLKEHAAKSLKDYLRHGVELSSILESIEFWYDNFRDRQHPDLPMWSDLPSPDKDQLFDAWIEALEDGILARRVSSPSPASSPSPLSSPLEQAKTSQEAPVCEVEQLREVSYGIIKQICRSLHALGAPIGVLAAVGSWGDTLEESEVLELLEAENARLVPQVTGSDCVTLPRVVVEEVEKTLGTAFSFVDGFSGPKSEKLNKAISSALSSLRASLKPQA
jgi:hypothetical protein